VTSRYLERKFWNTKLRIGQNGFVNEICIQQDDVANYVRYERKKKSFINENWKLFFVFHHHHRHISVMALGPLLTRSGLTYPVVSSKFLVPFVRMIAVTTFDTCYSGVLPTWYFVMFLIITYKPDVLATNLTIRRFDGLNVARPFSAQ